MNILSDPGRAEIQDILAQRRDQYSHVAIRSALAEKDGEWRNCLATVILADGEAPRPKPLTYSRFEIHEVVEDPDEVLHIVEQLCVESTITVAGRSISLADGRFDRLGSSFGRRVSVSEAWIPTEWPGDHFLFSAQRQVNPPSDPLVALGLPAYPTAYSAIQHMFGMDTYGGKTYDGGVYFLFPDYRARIDGVELGLEGISIKLSRKYSPSSKVMGKIYAESKHGEVFQKDISLSNLEEGVAFGFQPDHIYVAVLMETSGELLDEWKLSPYGTDRNLKIDLSDPRYVERLVSQGENDSVEFKPGVRDHGAKREWAESAIAFANRKGGVILVGVDDNGRISGVHGGDWVDIISESLRERCEPTIGLDVQRVVVAEDVIVYVVRVNESSNKPHMMKGAGIIYLRVGSTDKPVTRYELDELYQQKSNRHTDYSQLW